LGGSKKFKGKLCVYCRRNESTTADHVFPRELFQIEQRDQLPKVPSCVECNNEKSKLEHYLSAVLPFGATHSNSEKALSVDAAKRLEKNQKLHKELKRRFGYRQVPSEHGGTEERLVVELNYEALHDFVGFIGRALMWHHWGTYLPSEFRFIVFTPSSSGIEYISRLFEMSSDYRVDVKLGGDTVRYKGVMSEVDEGLSIWAIQLLGGMTVSDKSLGYVFKNSFVAMVTGPSKAIENLERSITT
jgi:glutaredoxin